MEFIKIWCRLDLRLHGNRWTALILLFAIAAGSSMWTANAAFRGATSVDRLMDSTLPADTAIYLGSGPVDWDAIRRLPLVEAIGVSINGSTPFSIEGVPSDRVNIVAPGDMDLFSKVEKPRVLEGRFPDPTSSSEVAINPAFQKEFGIGLGDTLAVRLFSPEQIDAPGDPVTAEGPAIELRVVAVARTPLLAETLSTSAGVMCPYGLFDAYRANFLGTLNSGHDLTGFTRLHGGASNLDELSVALQALLARSNIDLPNYAEANDQDDRINELQATFLFSIATAASVVAIILIGHIISAHSRQTFVRVRSLSASGITPTEIRMAARLLPILCAVSGTLIALGVAIAGSRWTPVGRARLSEPAQGTWVEPTRMCMGAFFALLVGILITEFTVLRNNRPSRHAHRKTLVRLWGRPIPWGPVGLGLRFALRSAPESDRVSPALIAGSMGIATLTMSLMLSSGIEHVLDSPKQAGWAHQVQLYIGDDGIEDSGSDRALELASRAEKVTSVLDARVSIWQSPAGAVPVYSYAPVGHPMDFDFQVGRLPEAESEVALGVDTARELSLQVGSSVSVTGDRTSRVLTVVGIGFTPNNADRMYFRGGWLSNTGYGQLFSSYRQRLGLIALKPGVEPRSAAESLTEAVREEGLDLEFEVAPPTYPIVALSDLRKLPQLLASLLAAIAIMTIRQSLIGTVRRRHDFTVLRALGLTSTQARTILLAQAGVTVALAIVAGVAGGVLVGRLIWAELTATTVPLVYRAELSVSSLVVIVAGASAAAGIFSFTASRKAARRSLSTELRA